MIIEIVERDAAGTIYLRAHSDRGTIEAITDVRIEGDAAYLDHLHIDGPGARTIGVQGLRALGRELARQLGVRRLVVSGGVRTTGANPGRKPRPIVIRLEEERPS